MAGDSQRTPSARSQEVPGRSVTATSILTSQPPRPHSTQHAPRAMQTPETLTREASGPRCPEKPPCTTATRSLARSKRGRRGSDGPSARTVHPERTRGLPSCPPRPGPPESGRWRRPDTTATRIRTPLLMQCPPSFLPFGQWQIDKRGQVKGEKHAGGHFCRLGLGRIRYPPVAGARTATALRSRGATPAPSAGL